MALLTKQWLKNPTYGVNEILKTIPLVEDHDRPKDVTVYADVDDELWEEGILAPPKTPALIVIVDADTVEESDSLKVVLVAAAVRIAICYVVTDTGEMKGRRDGAYVLRCVRKSLRRWMKHGTDVDKKLNKIKMVKVARITETTIGGGVGKAQLWGGVLADVTAQDEDP